MLLPAKRMLQKLVYGIFPCLQSWISEPKIGFENVTRRDAWVVSTLGRVPPGLRIMDLGAGEQPYRRWCRHLRYVSQDFRGYDGKGDGRGLQTGEWNQKDIDIVCDITKIPEVDSSFDAILCTEVIEHVPEPIAALHECARLLKPGGTLILTAPFISFTHFAPYHYHTGFNRYFFEHHLVQAGFNIKELSFNGNFFELVAQEVRRIPWAMDRYSTKSLRAMDRLLLRRMLNLLEEINNSNNGSEEFASFGVHVIAERA